MKNTIIFILILASSVFIAQYSIQKSYDRGRTEGHAAAMRQCKAQNSIKQDSTPATVSEILDSTLFNY